MHKTLKERLLKKLFWKVSKTHDVFSFLLGTSCILQFSEIQGEVINPLGFPNEWDTSGILLPKTDHSCFYLGIKNAFLNVVLVR